MNDIVEVMNLDTGERGKIRRKHFENPRINDGILVEVDPEQKPYVSELYKSRLPEDDEIEDGDTKTDEEKSE